MSVGPLVCRDERQLHAHWQQAEQSRRYAENLRSRLRASSQPAMPSRCNGCGSSEYVRHAGRHICAYCRRAA